MSLLTLYDECLVNVFFLIWLVNLSFLITPPPKKKKNLQKSVDLIKDKDIFTLS